jgi:hypothetical protein
MCMKHLMATKQHAYKSENDLQKHINMFVKCTIFKSKPIDIYTQPSHMEKHITLDLSQLG